MMPASKWSHGVWAIAVLSLLILLVRENEGRTAAEKKIDDIKYQMNSSGIEKDNAIMNLQSNVDQLESKLEDAGKRYDMLAAEKEQALAQKDRDMETLKTESEGRIQAKESEIKDIEAQSQAQDAKYTKLLKEKNDEIADLGRRLKDATDKIDAQLKKIQSLEEEKLAGENTVADLLKKVRRLESEKAELLAAAAQTKDKPAALD